MAKGARTISPTTSLIFWVIGALTAYDADMEASLGFRNISRSTPFPYTFSAGAPSNSTRHVACSNVYVQILTCARRALYTPLINFESDEFHSAVAKDTIEAQKLIKAGFEYVCSFDGVMLFRKRK